MRGIFFDEDDARAAAARLMSDGYTTRVERERLAGEDDDEDHPWALLTDAPPVLLELLVEEYDGWLDDADEDDGSGAVPPPIELPTQPRRRHRDH